MAEQFEITAALPSQELDAAGRIVDTMSAAGATIPHGVSFTVTVLKEPGWRDRLLALAAEEARELESLFDA